MTGPSTAGRRGASRSSTTPLSDCGRRARARRHGFRLRADQELLVEDHFCGAGGTTTGLRKVDGIRVVHAANHDPLAIQTHSTAYPDIEHSCADIPSMNPRRCPEAHVLFTSPECKARSYARGKPKDDPTLFDPKGDKTAERSRATMDEVTRFAAEQQYIYVVVENVPQVIDWCEPSESHHSEKCNCGVTYRRWLRDMENIGYRRHRALFLNSMLFENCPQSRDRCYIVFALDGAPFPDLDHTCLAYCEEHGVVMAGQHAKTHLKPPETVRKAWRALDSVWGRYDSQYYYSCPECGQRAEPAITPAITAIEWDRDPGPRICEREDHGMPPLSGGTIERCARGVLKLPDRPLVVPLSYLHNPASKRARGVEEALATLTCQHLDALVVAVGGNLSERAGQTRAWSVDEVLRTITATRDRGLMVPGRENAVPTSLDRSPMPTATTINSLYQMALPLDPPAGTDDGRRDALIVSNMRGNVPGVAGEQPMGAATTVNTLSVMGAPQNTMIGVNRRHTNPVGADGQPLQTVIAGGEQHFMLVPAGGSNAKRGARAGDGFRDATSETMPAQLTRETTALVVANNGGPASKPSARGHARDVATEVLGTQTGGGQHAILTMRGQGQMHSVTDAMPTCATVEQHALMTAIYGVVANSTFRMLDPSEIARGMVMRFKADGELYRICGGRRQQVRQLGNAVTPPVATWIATRLRNALQGA
jgi:DNA (cytosine-5)-methyltransferase 1